MKYSGGTTVSGVSGSGNPLKSLPKALNKSVKGLFKGHHSLRHHLLPPRLSSLSVHLSQKVFHVFIRVAKPFVSRIPTAEPQQAHAACIWAVHIPTMRMPNELDWCFTCCRLHIQCFKPYYGTTFVFCSNQGIHQRPLILCLRPFLGNPILFVKALFREPYPF